MILIFITTNKCELIDIIIFIYTPYNLHQRANFLCIINPFQHLYFKYKIYIINK